MNAAPAHDWLLLESGAGNAGFNMAMDAALMERAATFSQPVLRFYGWTEPAASFGYFQKFVEIERVTHLRPLVRRPTGGGLVPHDFDWTYSVTIPRGTEWYQLRAIESYRRVHEWVRLAFLEMGVETNLAESRLAVLPGQCFEGHEQFDVLCRGRKIAGAAQRRTASGLLIQGSVQPPEPGLARSDWEKAMCHSAQRAWGSEWKKITPDADLIQLAKTLAETKYANVDFIRSR